MFAPGLEVHRPTGLEEALRQLERHAGDVAFCAGGTDLVPRLRSGRWTGGHVVCGGRLPELTRVDWNPAGVSVGAAVTYRALVTDARLQVALPALHGLVAGLANPRVRNRGTLGGVLCAARPRYDPTTLLVALGATATVVCAGGGLRTVPVREFVLAERRTALAPTELLRSVEIPFPTAGTRVGFARVGTTQGPLVNVAVAASVDRATVVVGAAAPVPVVVEEATDAVLAGDVDTAVRQVAAAAWSESPSPASPWYRSRVAGTLMQRLMTRTVAA